VCVEAASTVPSTSGNEDDEMPSLGNAFCYVVEYRGSLRSGFGTEEVAKSHVVPSGGCDSTR
jgi:hypothetical protein